MDSFLSPFLSSKYLFILKSQLDCIIRKGLLDLTTLTVSLPQGSCSILTAALCQDSCVLLPGISFWSYLRIRPKPALAVCAS